MADVFDDIFGQPRVREFLRSVHAQKRLAHAYLFCGPAGSNKTLAASALAAAVVCEQGTGCGHCDECQRVRKRCHPDVHYLAPEGAAAYVVSQIRELIADVSLAPIRAHTKVYILDRVDLLGTQAANAFLKTLEEPPANVLFILLGRTQESVLPTVVSRCQLIPFRAIPESEAAGLVSQHTGATPDRARQALLACDGSISRAIRFLGSSESMELRRQVLQVLATLRTSDDGDLVQQAAALLVAAKAPLDEVRAAQEQKLAQNADFLSKSAQRTLEQKNKRALSAEGTQHIHQVIAIARGWVRDVLACVNGAGDLVVNTDVREAIEEAARHTDSARIVASLDALAHCDAALAYNVSFETCMDAVLLLLRQELFELPVQRFDAISEA